MKKVDFFFDLSSPYSYLAATLMQTLAERTGASVTWKPMVLGAVFKSVGNEMPARVPPKGRWIGRDLGRPSVPLAHDDEAHRRDEVHREPRVHPERDAVAVGPAREVLQHPARLDRRLRRHVVRGRLEHREQHHRTPPDGRAGPRGEAGELRRREVAVGRGQVEEEVERRHPRRLPPALR